MPQQQVQETLSDGSHSGRRKMDSAASVSSWLESERKSSPVGVRTKAVSSTCRKVQVPVRDGGLRTAGARPEIKAMLPWNKAQSGMDGIKRQWTRRKGQQPARLRSVHEDDWSPYTTARQNHSTKPHAQRQRLYTPSDYAIYARKHESWYVQLSKRGSQELLDEA
jgi:hypothetical protein